MSEHQRLPKEAFSIHHRLYGIERAHLEVYPRYHILSQTPDGDLDVIAYPPSPKWALFLRYWADLYKTGQDPEFGTELLRSLHLLIGDMDCVLPQDINILQKTGAASASDPMLYGKLALLDELPKFERRDSSSYQWDVSASLKDVKIVPEHFSRYEGTGPHIEHAGISIYLSTDGL